MRILIDAGHPAHVHFFRHFARIAGEHGHRILFTARDKEVTLALLRAYGFDFYNRGHIQNSLLKKAAGLLGTDLRIYRKAREFRPDILLGIHNPYVAHAGKLLRKPSVIFTDTENVRIASLLTYPFATVICTPACFREQIPPEKHVQFNGYKEIAYLHPRYFQPEPDVLENAGLSRDEPFTLLRLISWGASHDVGLSGIRSGREADMIRALEDHGKVLITSERPLGPDLEKHRVTIPPHRIHSLLHYARLYIGEGGTMTTEAALLGTPAIHIEANSEGQPTGAASGNFLELRDRYDLIRFYANQDQALDMALQILGDRNSKAEWQRKRDILLGEKIDVTAWMTDFVERFPESFAEAKVRHV